MVRKPKEISSISEDLNGLLLQFKKDNTYFKVLVHHGERKAMLQVTQNPLYWKNIPIEHYDGFREMKRVELNLSKLYVNYMSPQYLLYAKGATLGINIPLKQLEVENRLYDTEKYYTLQAGIKFLPDIIIAVHNMVYMQPQMKYEIIGDYLVSHQ